MLSVELREHRGSWSVSNGLLSCVSGNNCCRAHSSESEDLGSVTKSEGFRVACLSRRKFRDRDERGEMRVEAVRLCE
jgi:hypothetical protein